MKKVLSIVVMISVLFMNYCFADAVALDHRAIGLNSVFESCVPSREGGYYSYNEPAFFALIGIGSLLIVLLFYINTKKNKNEFVKKRVSVFLIILLILFNGYHAYEMCCQIKRTYKNFYYGSENSINRVLYNSIGKRSLTGSSIDSLFSSINVFNCKYVFYDNNENKNGIELQNANEIMKYTDENSTVDVGILERDKDGIIKTVGVIKNDNNHSVRVKNIDFRNDSELVTDERMASFLRRYFAFIIFGGAILIVIKTLIET